MTNFSSLMAAVGIFLCVLASCDVAYSISGCSRVPQCGDDGMTNCPEDEDGGCDRSAPNSHCSSPPGNSCGCNTIGVGTGRHCYCTGNARG